MGEIILELVFYVKNLRTAKMCRHEIWTLILSQQFQQVVHVIYALSLIT